MYVYVAHACLVPEEAEEGIGSLRTRITDSCEWHVGARDKWNCRSKKNMYLEIRSKSHWQRECEFVYLANV